MNFPFVSPALESKCRWAVNSSELSPHVNQVRSVPPVLNDALEAVGGTPLIRLNRIPAEHGIRCQVLVKCEYFNPGGSVKDRIVLRMMEEAEREGKIKPGFTLIEPTSGNTGIGLALACAVKGYKCIIVMPMKMSSEKENVIRALGAEVVRTPTAAAYDDPSSNIAMAQQLARTIPNSFVLDQFRNKGNPLSHYDGTAEEILIACDNKVDMIVCTAGTGGTVAGIGRKIREKLPSCKVIGVDPEFSLLAPGSKNQSGFYEVEGIGYDFIPTILDLSVVDEWVKINDKESFPLARDLIRKEGILAGGSSGSALAGAFKVCKHLTEEQTVVIILADGVRNYMTKFLDPKWMKARGFPLNTDVESQLVPSSTPIFWKDSISKMLLDKNNQFVTIEAGTTVSETISILRENGFDQIPVIDNGSIIGIITVSILLINISSGSLSMDSLVGNSVNRSFPKMCASSSIGELDKMLRNAEYVVITRESNTDEPIGIITPIDLLTYGLGHD